jgi:glycosyltransferase involved in cell wall biosynthesis
MRVANLTGFVSRQSGGLFESVRGLAINTQNLGCKVEVFGLRDEFTESDLPAWGSVSVRTHPVVGPRSFGFSPGLARSVQNSGIDLLHVHGLWTYLSVASLMLSRRSKLPLVVSPHGMLDPWAVRNSAWKKKLANWLYEGAHLHRAACLHALCKSEAASIRALGLRNPICVIPHGQELPPDTTPKGPRERSSLVLDRKTLLFLGRLHPKKGLPNLLRAWAVCQKSEHAAINWTLVVAGWDQDGHEGLLKRMVCELAIADSVLFPGPLFGGAKDHALRSAQALVLPSYSEGVPVAVLEAWARRLPVLMTPQCNLPEGFAESAAIRVEPEVDSLGHGLSTLFRMNGSEREQMGARGRRLVEERFSWRRAAEQMVCVYRWVLGGGPRPDCVVDA